MKGFQGRRACSFHSQGYPFKCLSLIIGSVCRGFRRVLWCFLRQAAALTSCENYYGISGYTIAFFVLAGGFSKFQAEFALHCETNLDGSCSSSSPPLPVLGLGGLRISSDSSSDIESDLDRDPNSATDSDGSPLSNSQPSFPVEILPFLYLGCAKDSTNLDVLEEFGIKYILNVTPNLPNLFENAGEFKYKQIPISDHWSQNLSQFFPEAISFIGETNIQSFLRLLNAKFLAVSRI